MANTMANVDFSELALTCIKSLQVAATSEEDGPQIYVMECKYLISELPVTPLNFLTNCRQFYWLVKRAESLVHVCCSKNWLHAALARLDVEKSFDELILEFSNLMFFGECGRSKSDRLKIFERKDEKRRRELPVCYDNDRKELLTRLKKIVDFHKYFRRPNGVAKIDLEVATYLWQRLSGFEAASTSTLPSHYLLKVDPSWKNSRVFLGSGGNGTVFLTNWLGISCAMKVLKDGNVKRFEQEAGVLFGLKHPNIVQAYCCAVDGEECTLLMELMHTDLWTFIQRRKQIVEGPPFPYPVCEDIMFQISKGMEYLHGNGIVHRDLKALNILVNPTTVLELQSEGYVHAKVADFGMAKSKIRSSTSSQQSLRVGTTYWRAPELFDVPENANRDGTKYPKMADVYSFGMLCYEIVSGEVPFDSTDLGDLHGRITRDDERPELPQSCPHRLIDIIRRCWDTTPQNRPSFSEIRRLLEN